MSRQSLLPGAWLSIAFGLAVVAAPTAAWSQDSSTQERLDRLERDLNMLQRQVYRGAPPPVGGGGAAVNGEIRMDRLEAQMRDLTGRVEEFTNQIEQVRQRVEQVTSDVDTRFSQTTAAGPLAPAIPAPARPGSAASPRATRQFAAETPGAADEDLPPPRHVLGTLPGASIPPGTAVAPPGGAAPPGAPTTSPAPIFGTLTPPGLNSVPTELAGAAPAGRTPAAGALAGGSAAEQYNHAFGLLKQADYPAAEAALKAFVEQHPTDPMAGNAQYWLGETYYTRSRFLEAASAFAEGYKRYPKSAKAADNLLKLAMALGRANQKQNACLALAQLDHDFPKAGAAVTEHAAAEKKRLGC
jgi:tol-pal system protein YbgF